MESVVIERAACQVIGFRRRHTGGTAGGRGRCCVAFRDVASSLVLQRSVKAGGGRLVLNPHVSRSLSKAFLEVSNSRCAGRVGLGGQVAPVGSVCQGVVQHVGGLKGAGSTTVWDVKDTVGKENRIYKIKLGK